MLVHAGSDMNNISGYTDASSSAGIGAFVHATRLRATRDVMQEWSIHYHLHMRIANSEQLTDSATMNVSFHKQRIIIG